MNPTTKSSSALFLQGATVVLGLGVLTLLLWEPHLEGRNAQATPFEIYFHDPFLAYVYVGSIPFFAALYRAFGLLGDVRKHGAFSPATVQSLHAIKRCAFALGGFVAGGIVFVLAFGDPDDRPAGLFMGLLALVGASVIAAVAAVFARNLHAALLRSGRSRD